MRPLLAVLALSIAFAAAAQTPISTAGQPFVLNVHLPVGDPVPQSVEVDGFTINILLRGEYSVLPIGVSVPVNIPGLPAGTYTVNVAVQYTDGDGNIVNERTVGPFTIIIAPAVHAEHIPALDPRALGILAITLAFAAVLVMRRV